MTEEIKQALIDFCENHICRECPFKKDKDNPLEYGCKLSCPCGWEGIPFIKNILTNK